MDVSGGLSLVQTILQVFGSPIWTEIESVLGVQSQLEKLKLTMSTIQDVLLDAEEQERRHHVCPSHVERGILVRLKEALYQADDLFDEVTTFAHRKKLMPGNKLSKEVSRFCSCFNQLRSDFIWSREIKSIREELDDVVNDHQLACGIRHSVDFVDSRVRNNPRETHSHVNLENDVIIGRDDDKRLLIDTLLDTTVEENVSVVSIVGIGGLGKTTLAQLVYNDYKIKREFPLKMWVCVSDNFNVKALAGQILAAATDQVNQSDGFTMDQLQIKLRERLDRSKYLLVLDDVWNENSEVWRTMKILLVGGGKGSRVLVTTRSKKVAVVMGSCWTHELKGLSDEESWNLFQRMTLEPEQHQTEANLVDIGKEIVRKCATVPLAIRVIGRLLRGQDESQWQNLKNNLENIIQDEANGIIPVLKISYNYLPFHLKSCFSYCAVFPKDYKIIKEDLICRWMAQGFIMPYGESFEDAGDKYFEQLLQRCFFQDVERAEDTEEIVSCKMHDLIHDLAKEVAGTDILLCTYSTRNFNKKTRHVYMDETHESTPEDIVGKLSDMQRMRTFLYSREGPRDRSFSLKPFVEGFSNVKYLRVLRLNNFKNYEGLEELPSGIGELVHLRYLDLIHYQSL
ncbi:putative disease resistance protein RGA3 [Chenopodium quinoa]|uniref:putative disease resistance protein RGA3 n=1 Tax=Chenopodium quinoa TaxID=63459 RepID=UPI000B78D7F0|nr:putative disease resistance protein RGA3 [Chenopodium quinoa]XP_021776275.1 putative disease resistance protein RGA3 [Chenopodium quinoa]